MSPPLDALAIRRTLRDEGLRARHGLSQNFLADADVLERILAEADPRPGRRVLEIGPGLGMLTAGLLAAGAAVTAIELDPGLVAYLRERFAVELDRDEGPSAVDDGGRGAGRAAEDASPAAQGRLRLIEGNALDLPLTSFLDPPYDVVANLPYHITSPILHAILGEPPPPARAVLMVQREVAERIAAPPGGLSYLAVFVQYHARVRIATLVAPDAFEPEPAVESAVVVLEPKVPALPDREAEDELWRLVQAAFRERRKMLHNVLARQLPVETARVDEALTRTGIAPDRRPQTLSVEEWLALRDALGPLVADERGRRRQATDDGPTADG
jgi:16S rRNA (adenine1518-N6/adenine1519-N6)-dimethyltransferase